VIRARIALLRPARRQAGYSVVELLVVLGILATVLGALLGAWVSGMHAEIDATQRYQAQQQARVAVDRMRDEFHCGDQLTFTSAASISIRLPADCPGTGGATTNVTWTTELVSTGRYRLKRGAVVVGDYLTSGSVFEYIAPTASALGKLRVTLPVDRKAGDAIGAWTLRADIVLRNTVRA